MRFQTQVLSEAEQERIHQSSLRILEEVGVRFLGEKALPLLARHGAKVDWGEKIAHIPGELVEQCLATMPKSFVLGARNPQYDYLVPSGESRFCIDGTAAFALDFESGQRRYGVRQDITNALRIFQTLELGIMAWAPTCASDMPAPARALSEFFAMAGACSKHGEHELHTVGQAPYLVEGLTAIMGSEAAFKERKCFSLIYCPVAPLSHDGEMLDAYLALGEWEMPVTSMPMPICGTTGPASLFGNLCLANAENLSSVVVYQLNNPGRPMMMGNATGIVDFLSGAYLGGVSEMGLMSAGMTAMAHYYGAPSCAAGVTADAKSAGPEAVLQKFSTTLPPMTMNADVIVGYGAVEGDQLLVLEQLVVDEEIAQWCRRLAQGIDGGEGKDLFEDIKQVGPGGHFLKSKNTRLAPRSGEFYIDRLMPRGSYEGWAEAGKPTMYQRAHERVIEILAGPVVDPLPEAVSGKLDEIVRRAAAELKDVGE
jgi:trimethylamine--corrinoid protein Co-methyltransferase